MMIKVDTSTYVAAHEISLIKVSDYGDCLRIILRDGTNLKYQVSDRTRLYTALDQLVSMVDNIMLGRPKVNENE